MITKGGYGLYFEIFTGLPQSNYYNFLFETESTGIIVEIKDPDGFSRILSSQTLGPGQSSLINLSKITDQIIPKPYSSCDNLNTYKSPVFDRMKNDGVIF